VGFVFQFYNLIPSLTALENVAAVTEIAEAPMRPEEALEMVGLSDRMRHLPFPAFGRPAAAGGHCAGDRQTAERAAVR
jgi:predicted ABC-type transport system involved in lysophospholipase L1 biosynthesis ATPase subunit